MQSPKLLNKSEARTMNDEPSDLDAALACVDNDNAGHWPTVAGILADAYREQRDRLQKIVDEQCRVSSVCREYREQRDRLAEALARTRNMIQTHPEAAESCATEALQSLTTNEQ